MSRKLPIQFLRGTKAQNNEYVGPIGSLSVDTTDTLLSIHDGTTPGGMPLAPLSQVFTPADIWAMVRPAPNRTEGILDKDRLDLVDIMRYTGHFDFVNASSKWIWDLGLINGISPFSQALWGIGYFVLNSEEDAELFGTTNGSDRVEVTISDGSSNIYENTSITPLANGDWSADLTGVVFAPATTYTATIVIRNIANNESLPPITVQREFNLPEPGVLVTFKIGEED